MSSLNRTSLIARKLTSLNVCITTKMDFIPEVYQQYAGMLIYYDNMDYIMLRKTYSDSIVGSVIDLLRVKNGERIELLKEAIPVRDESIYFRIIIRNRETRFFWSMNGDDYAQIGDSCDTSEFSDEFCKHGEFTGTFIGIGCVDALLHEKCAYFDFLDYQILPI
jgi:xylan 1,4-beta-xylosidase